MKVLMTGATGFVGGQIARRLLGEATIRAAVRNPCEHLDSLGVQQVLCHLGELDSDLLQGIDVIVHTAATTENDLVSARAVNRDGTRNLVNAALRAGVPRFIHISTTAVYDMSQVDSWEIGEDAPLAEEGRVARAYSVTKAEAEDEVVRGGDAGLSTVILRPPAVLGAGPTSTWGTCFARNWLAGSPRPLHPEATRAWIHVDDLADGVAIAASGSGNLVANVVAGHTQMSNYIDGIRNMLGDVVDLPRPNGKPWRGTFATNRMNDDLGLTPTRSFNQAMDEIAAYWAANWTGGDPRLGG